MAAESAPASASPAPGRPPENGAVDRERFPGVTVGEGYAIASIDDAGAGYGFRKVRRALGVTAFGVNALVREPGYETKWHYHDVQEELYFVHRGAIEMEFGDGSRHRLDAGSFARVDAPTIRRIRILGPGETIYICAGGKDGYVRHDGKTPESL
ncbi:MAG TPA: cupin domain-containing protein [Solirubrobacteraceae bacterium]|jgi:quercetin dioxygenase-like cupin family protein|nr:cupin domain-containing protein [Solirubrobacteraceae bacterium]